KTVHELGISLGELKVENQMTERLQEILNRKPQKWGNLTVKEFERDIKLLQERVQELEELTHKQGKVIIKQNDELDIFDQQNQRYREAIEESSQKRMAYADMAGVLRIEREALEGGNND